MSRTVHCVVDQTEAPGLPFAPLPGELGQKIYEQVGQPAWNRWLSHQTMLINEHRLSPREPKAKAFLLEQLQAFLFEGGASKPEGYVPEA